MIVCLGVDNTFLDEPISSQVLRTLWLVADMHTRLWNIEGHTTNELDDMDEKIMELSESYKAAFSTVTTCDFPKFHYLLHLTSVIQEFGSMRTVDTCYGEVWVGLCYLLMIEYLPPLYTFRATTKG